MIFLYLGWWWWWRRWYWWWWWWYENKKIFVVLYLHNTHLNIPNLYTLRLYSSFASNQYFTLQSLNRFTFIYRILTSNVYFIQWICMYFLFQIFWSTLSRLLYIHPFIITYAFNSLCICKEKGNIKTFLSFSIFLHKHLHTQCIMGMNIKCLCIVDVFFFVEMKMYIYIFVFVDKEWVKCAKKKWVHTRWWWKCFKWMCVRTHTFFVVENLLPYTEEKKTNKTRLSSFFLY